jgi:hypothetical protein
MINKLRNRYKNLTVWDGLEYLFVGVAFLTLIKVLSYYVETALFPFQLEYREGALLSLIPAMKQGFVPLSEAQTPEMLYVYGIGYPYLVFWFSHWVENPLVAGRLLSLIFNVCSTWLLFETLRRNKLPWIYALQVATIYFIYLAITASQMFPSAAAASFLALSIVIPYWFGPRFLPCLLGICVALIGFTMKQYAVISIPAILLFFLHHAKYKPKAWLQTFLLALPIPIWFWWLFSTFPNYYTVAFQLFQCYQLYSLEHMFNQVIHLFSHNFLHLGLLVLLLYNYRHQFFQTLQLPIGSANFSGIKNIAGDILLVQLIVSLVLFVVKLGLHPGSTHAFYLYHIADFFLLALIAPLLFQQLKSSIYQPFRVFMLLVPVWGLIVGIGVYTDFLFEKHVKNEAFYQAIEPYFQQEKNVYASPELASLAYQNQVKIWNNGCSEYALDLLNCAASSNPTFTSKVLEYKHAIDQKVAAQHFDFIFFEKNYYGNNVMNPDTLFKYYLTEKYFTRGENPDTTFLFVPQFKAATSKAAF